MLLIATCHQRKGLQIWNPSLLAEEDCIIHTEFMSTLKHSETNKQKAHVIEKILNTTFYAIVNYYKDYTM